LRSLTSPPNLNRAVRLLSHRRGPASHRRGPASRRALAGLAVAAWALAFAGGATAASSFYINGGGDGHGIGVSQYGA
jgi:hypothetical protein